MELINAMILINIHPLSKWSYYLFMSVLVVYYHVYDITVRDHALGFEVPQY